MWVKTRAGWGSPAPGRGGRQPAARRQHTQSTARPRGAETSPRLWQGPESCTAPARQLGTGSTKPRQRLGGSVGHGAAGAARGGEGRLLLPQAATRRNPSAPGGRKTALRGLNQANEGALGTLPAGQKGGNKAREAPQHERLPQGMGTQSCREAPSWAGNTRGAEPPAPAGAAPSGSIPLRAPGRASAGSGHSPTCTGSSTHAHSRTPAPVPAHQDRQAPLPRDLRVPAAPHGPTPGTGPSRAAQGTPGGHSPRAAAA